MSGREQSRRAVLMQAVIAGAAGLLSACDVGRSRRAAVAPIAPAATPVTRPGLKGTITVAYADELGKKPRYVAQAAATVQAAHPDATVRIDQQTTDRGTFYTSLLRALATGDAPDVIHLSGDHLGELADAGYIVPLDPYLGDWPDWRYYPPWVRGAVTYQGSIWAIPYGLDTRFLYIRRDLLAQAGLPRTWQPRSVDDILAAATAVKAAVPTAVPYVLYAGRAGDTGTANHGFMPLVYAYGGQLQDQRGRWVGDSIAIRKALTYYARAFQTERLSPASVLTETRPWTAAREQVGSGRLALLFEGGWVYGGWLERDRADAEANIGFLLHPTEKAGPSFTIGGPGTCWYIAAASRHKDLAWEFIKTWNNRDTVARLNIEDPHPVARVDAVRVPEYRREAFLVHSTNSLEKARFTPPDANYVKVVSAIQQATGRVAAGEVDPIDAAKRYAEDLAELLGPDRVVTEL